ncbi:MAG TPA: hypothetical protein PLT92_14185 [Ignavibacteriaceae bacterium]|nr:hypothetical protein [Ignavibacteriaceae bacterium]
MDSKSSIISLPMKHVETNASMGNYRPQFFELEEFALSRVDFNSHFFNECNVEEIILKGDYSFAYLREDKLRTINAYDKDNNRLTSSQFCKRLGLKIESKNLFKTGKYLSRIFRPTKYSGFFRNCFSISAFPPVGPGSTTDGISIIPLSLAQKLGWEDAKSGNSAQFTLFYKNGLIKGHCLISDAIGFNSIICTNFIKNDLKFDKDYLYIAIEPVKLSMSVRMDIQSLLNLWNLFGEEQYFDWAKKGIEQYKDALVSGKLSEILDDFEHITSGEYEKESWVLKKAIWHKIDYTRFPGLMRIGWQMFRKSILQFAERKGNPVFRIPVPSAFRGYLRCDLRDHDENGYFESSVPKGTIHLDKLGNIWIHKDNIVEYMHILSGGDQDDSAVVIPVEGNRAVLFRNPNQSGEYLIANFTHDPELEITHESRIIGSVTQKVFLEMNEETSVKDSTGNSLIDGYLEKKENEENYQDYNQTNLLRTFSKVASNGANIGIVANAEMIRSAIGIENQILFNDLCSTFCWNLERVIDSVVKDGVSCSEDLFAVNCMYEHLSETKSSIPSVLLNRLPEGIRECFLTDNKSRVDQLFEAVKFLIKETDKEVLGEGTASKHNRIPGLIDKCQVPLVEIGLSNIGNPFNDIAVSLLKDYNKRIAILLETTKDLSEEERENKRRSEIELIQEHLLNKLNTYTESEKILIINSIAYNIYRSEGYVHDSILWMTNKPYSIGTADYMLKLLANVELGAHIKSNGDVERYFERREVSTDEKVIRLWSKEKVSADYFKDVTEILIEDNKVLIGQSVMNLGEEVNIGQGLYTVKNIVQSISKKNNSCLKNSLSVYIS